MARSQAHGMILTSSSSLVEVWTSPSPTFGDFTNIPWFDKRRSTGANAVMDVNGHFRTAGLTHNVLLGTDYYNLDFSDRGFVNGWAPVDMMNIFHPVFRRNTAYGAHAALAATPPDWTSVGRTQWHGLYAQDQIGLLRNLAYWWADVMTGPKPRPAVSRWNMLIPEAHSTM